MGDAADLLLNGDQCEGCGAWLDNEGDGYPRYCSDKCAKDRGAYQEN